MGTKQECESNCISIVTTLYPEELGAAFVEMDSFAQERFFDAVATGLDNCDEFKALEKQGLAIGQRIKGNANVIAFLELILEGTKETE